MMGRKRRETATPRAPTTAAKGKATVAGDETQSPRRGCKAHTMPPPCCYRKPEPCPRQGRPRTQSRALVRADHEPTPQSLLEASEVLKSETKAAAPCSATRRDARPRGGTGTEPGPALPAEGTGVRLRTCSEDESRGGQAGTLLPQTTPGHTVPQGWGDCYVTKSPSAWGNGRYCGTAAAKMQYLYTYFKKQTTKIVCVSKRKVMSGGRQAKDLPVPNIHFPPSGRDGCFPCNSCVTDGETEAGQPSGFPEPPVTPSPQKLPAQRWFP